MKPSHLRGKERVYEAGFIAACFGILGVFYYATFERRDPWVINADRVSHWILTHDSHFW